MARIVAQGRRYPYWPCAGLRLSAIDRILPAMSDEPIPSGDAPSRAVADPSSHAPRLLLLNAIFPGLGHLVAGRWQWALLLALPDPGAARASSSSLAATGDPTRSRPGCSTRRC